MTAPAKRTFEVEKLARIYDDEIAPCWAARFARLLLRDLALPARSQVLDVACGTGYPTLEILRRMTEGSRLIAIDESSAMLDVVRRKVAALGRLAGKGVFFRTQSAVPKLAFADEVYDLVVCNLGLADMPSIAGALRDFARVAKPGGEVRCTLPLAGTFEEFHDLYREVLVKHDRHDALERLERHVARYPASDVAERWLAEAGLAGSVEIEEFSLLFRSSREFFFAPVIEYGPLAEWKAIAGDGDDMQDVFWHIKEAIDAYFAGGPFQLTVRAGCVMGKKAARPSEPLCLEAFDVITTPVPTAFDLEDSPFDDIDTGLPWPPQPIAIGSVRVSDSDVLADLEELGSGEFSLDDDARDEADLDAFLAGKKRPPHLVD
ncbi:MAG TPA: class I SAM-dependent methyltransferase [Kofleriaceae bacterium]|nr:class I SAM-dependent methyltransferase [Kofleriaceae bacterium]